MKTQKIKLSSFDGPKECAACHRTYHDGDGDICGRCHGVRTDYRYIAAPYGDLPHGIGFATADDKAPDGMRIQYDPLAIRRKREVHVAAICGEVVDHTEVSEIGLRKGQRTGRRVEMDDGVAQVVRYRPTNNGVGTKREVEAEYEINE